MVTVATPVAWHVVGTERRLFLPMQPGLSPPGEHPVNIQCDPRSLGFAAVPRFAGGLQRRLELVLEPLLGELQHLASGIGRLGHIPSLQSQGDYEPGEHHLKSKEPYQAVGAWVKPCVRERVARQFFTLASKPEHVGRTVVRTRQARQGSL
jgi:hypothetical protein